MRQNISAGISREGCPAEALDECSRRSERVKPLHLSSAYITFTCIAKEVLCGNCHTSASFAGVDKLCHGHVLLTTAIAIPFNLYQPAINAIYLSTELPTEITAIKTNNMAGHFNGAWHNMQGNGIPYRPAPTVDEAIPYSPFTSIIPFSLGQ